MSKGMRFFLFELLLLISNSLINAQNYQAINGSSYAGSLGVANNPASIVHVPFSWDITPIAFQLKQSTNAFVINNSSLFSPVKNAEVKGVLGDRKRFLMANQDIHLLNTRIRINSQSAIAFGVSIRNYLSAKTSTVNWRDTFSTLRDFIGFNAANSPLAASFRSNGWAEIYGTYARTLIDNENELLNGGVTLKINRGLGSAFVTGSNLGYIQSTVNGRPGYLLNRGELEYGYSSNFDDLDSGGTFSEIRKKLLNRTFSTIAASFGIEYIIPVEMEGDESNTYSYDLKVGVGLMDIGFNNFQYSSNSSRAILDKTNISDSLIQATFENIGSIDDLPDSLVSIAGTVTNLFGKFKMFQPARIVINADKHLSGNIFINGELTIPLTNIFGKNSLFVRDINFIAITPRYEIRSIGAYLPITFNIARQFWVGGAFRTGPLLIGIHNWGNLFGKNKMQNGGGYMALTFRPGKKHQKNNSTSRVKTEKLSRKQRKYLECPVL
jgi:hypothetical protein